MDIEYKKSAWCASNSSGTHSTFMEEDDYKFGEQHDLYGIYDTDDRSVSSAGITINSNDSNDSEASMDLTYLDVDYVFGSNQRAISTTSQEDDTSSWSQSSFHRLSTFVATKIFKKTDEEGAQKLSKNDIAQWVKMNPSLWSMLSVNLNLSTNQSIEIATRVLMESKDEKGADTAADAVHITKNEFRNFMKQYVEDPKGSQEFFHRCVFAAFDENRNRYLDAQEFDDFLNVFYESGSIFEGDSRLPKKEIFKKLIHQKYGKQNKFAFSEVQPFMSGLALQSIFEESSKLDNETNRRDAAVPFNTNDDEIITTIHDGSEKKYLTPKNMFSFLDLPTGNDVSW